MRKSTMTNMTRYLAVVLLSSLLAGKAAAHDPKLHKKSDEKPKCGAMKDMDHSKMKADDPVMQAMMLRCQKESSQKEDSKAKEKSTHAHDHE